jgi:hypothetical protein
MSSLVLLASADPSTGAGHAMRALTLAAAWRAAGGEAVLAGVVSLDFVRVRAGELEVPIVPVAPGHGDVLVVDCHDLSDRYRAASAGRFAVRVVVDDAGGMLPPGYDVVWNPNPYGHAGLYPGFAGRVLAGADFVPVREGLPRWSGPGDGTTLVSLGGGLPRAGLMEAMQRLAGLMPVEPFAITGEWGPRRWRRVPRADLWPAASRASRLVTGAGTTVWEAGAVGVPALLIQVTDGQRLAYRWGRDCGVPGLNAGLVDAEFLAHQLRALLAAARPLPPVASGASRVVAELRRFGAEART